MDDQHLYLNGKDAKRLHNHKVGTKVKMMVHGQIEEHSMQPDHTNEVLEPAYPGKGSKKSKPKMTHHTRIKIIRTEPPEAQVQTPLGQVMNTQS